MAPPYRITRDKVLATIGRGTGTVAAAKALQCNRRSLHRAAMKYGIPLNNRQCRVRGRLEWLQLYLKHGPIQKDVAKAVQMNATYVRMQLIRHGIITEFDRDARLDWAI